MATSNHDERRTGGRLDRPWTKKTPPQWRLIPWRIVVASTLLTAFCVQATHASDALRAASSPSAGGDVRPFVDARRQALQFIHYDDVIFLDPGQQKIMNDALTAIPAPCCANFSLATCCCPCNLARSSWGLAKYAIVEQGANVAEVRAIVEDWVRFIGPDGYSGDACFASGCNRPFAENGCGGMEPGQLRGSAGEP